MFNSQDAEKNGLKGGIIRGNQQRAEALKRYYASPRICEACGQIIQVHDGQHIFLVQKKRFCNKSCSMSWKRRTGITAGGAPPEVIANLTKEELLVRGLKKLVPMDVPRKEDVANRYSHSKISNDARRSYLRAKKPLICVVCGYSTHVEICHKKAVGDFPAETLINIINDPANLVALCRNHHWEQEHGLLSPEDHIKVLNA